MTADPIPHEEELNRLRNMYEQEWALHYGIPVERIVDENIDGTFHLRKQFVIGHEHHKSKALCLFAAVDELMRQAKMRAA